MGIGASTGKFGIAAALLGMAFSSWTGASKNNDTWTGWLAGQGGELWDGLSQNETLGGKDGLLANLTSSGAATSAAAFAGVSMLPNWMGEFKQLGQWLAGGLLAWNLLQSTLKGDFNGAVNYAAEKLDLNADARVGKNPASAGALSPPTTTAEDIAKSITLSQFEQSSGPVRTSNLNETLGVPIIPAVDDKRLATATKLADGLNRSMADAGELTASGSGKHGIIPGEDIKIAANIDPDTPELDNEG